jgi:lysophospholipase L1-like esterase
LATFTRIDSYVRSRGAQLSILFIEQPADREPRDDFTANAKKMLAQWASAHGVALIATATELEARGGERMFRDGLHPNEPGNALIADMVSRYVIDWQRQQGAPPG